MNNFKSIYLFEIKSHFTRIANYIFFLLLGFFAFMNTINTDPQSTFIYQTGQNYHNAPIIVAFVMTYLSIFGLIFSVTIVSPGIYKDFSSQSHNFFFTTHIKKSEYIAGRFLGGLTINVFVYFGTIIGFILGSAFLDPSLVGPHTLKVYFLPIVLFVIPNLFLFGILFFAISSLTRSILGTYIISIVVMVLFAFIQGSSDSFTNQTIKSLIDPFGVNALSYSVQFWSVAEKNLFGIPLNNMVLLNRLLWFSVGLVIFIFTYHRFKFVDSLEKKKSKKLAYDPAPEFEMVKYFGKLKEVNLNYTLSANIQKIFKVVITEFKRIVFHPAFIIITLLAINQAYHNFVVNAGPNGSNVYPFTSFYLIQSGKLFFYMIPIAIFFSGVLIWREYDFKSNEMYDVIPLSNAAVYVSKLFSLLLIQTYFVTIIMITGIFAQVVVFGFTDIELQLYLKTLYGIDLPYYWHMGVAAMFFHILSGNKYTGYFFATGYIVLNLLLLQTFEVTTPMSSFGSIPAYIYSNLNGFGHYAAAITWYRLYWLFGGLVIVSLSYQLWKRGYESNLRKRIKIAKYNLNKFTLAGVFGCMLLFFITGSFIYYNTRMLNKLVTTEQTEKRLVDYEVSYSSYKDYPQPVISIINTEIDIYAKDRSAFIRGSYVLQNKTSVVIDTVLVTISPRRLSTINFLKLDRPHRTAHVNKDISVYKFVPEIGMQPGETLKLEFDFEILNKGFVEAGANNRIVANGSYIDNFPFSFPAYFPTIGYNQLFELINNETRSEYGLPPKRRLPDAADPKAINKSFNDLITYETVISTDSDQMGIATGKLQRKWVANNRNYYHYKIDRPFSNALVFVSGRYEKYEEEHNGLTMEIYYDKKHKYNIMSMIRGIKASLSYSNENFGFRYPYEVVRVVEVPAYGIIGGTARSHPTIFTWNETGGFISNLEDPNSLDVVFNTTTHEMAHQWWAHIVRPANVEGLGIMAESIAQYVRLMCMKEEFGIEKTRRFLRSEMNSYFFSRGRALFGEPTLIHATNEGYINYRKGSVVMYALQDFLGEENVNRALANIVIKYGLKDEPFPTVLNLVDQLRAVTPDSLQYVITDNFEYITLYANKALESNFERLANGKYKVKLSTETKKFRSDGLGNETITDLNDYIDIGVIGKNNKTLYLQKHKIDKEKMEFEIIIDELPVSSGIDPYVILLDRNRNDNIVSTVEKSN